MASLYYFCVSIDNFKHVLYAVLLMQSLTRQDKCIWIGQFVQTNFIFSSRNSHLQKSISFKKVGINFILFFQLFFKKVHYNHINRVLTSQTYPGLFINFIQDRGGEVKMVPPCQLFPSSFYKRRTCHPKLSDF